MHGVEAWLGTIPPIAVYLLLFFVIGIESMGIPLPGEVALVSASLLAAAGAVSPVWVGAAAAAGAIVGDSVGYWIGRRGGPAVFDRLGRRFPKHLGPDKIDRARRAFHRHGIWAVFFGRFIALLRILAGPIAGSMRLPYWKFLLANAGGGVFWAGGTTAVIYFLGRAAERWLKDFSWALLVLVVAGGAVTALVVRHRARRLAAGNPGDTPAEKPGDEPAEPLTPAERQ